MIMAMDRQSEQTEQPKPLTGIPCPRCGVRQNTTLKTLKLSNGSIRRYRLCGNCDKHFRTVEATG